MFTKFRDHEWIIHSSAVELRKRDAEILSITSAQKNGNEVG